MSSLIQAVAENWIVWFVVAVLVVAAVIDGLILKVPNWLNFPFILTGWLHWSLEAGWPGFGWSLVGTVVGMTPLLLLRNVGGMGAGDVKLAAGTGAWLGAIISLKLFIAGAIAGGVIALGMIVWSGNARKHLLMARQILHEWKTVRKPERLAAIARERKPEMTLLPYGIPMAIGSVIYLGFAGMLI